MPVGAEDLKKLIRKEEQELKQKEKLIQEVVRELALQNVGAEYAVPRIRFVEEDGIADHMYTRSAAWDESIAKYDSHWWGFQDHTFVEQYRKWIDWYWKQSPKNIELKLLSNQSEVERRMEGRHARRAIKFWDKGNFTATTWVLGDYLVFIRTNEHPFYLVEIHDALLSHNMREVFKNLWPLV